MRKRERQISLLRQKREVDHNKRTKSGSVLAWLPIFWKPDASAIFLVSVAHDMNDVIRLLVKIDQG